MYEKKYIKKKIPVTNAWTHIILLIVYIHNHKLLRANCGHRLFANLLYMHVIATLFER